MIIQYTKKLALTVLTAIPMLIAGHAGAVPAKPGLITFDNGGKQIEVFLRGDEHSHYYETPDGFMLLRGDDGLFRYAVPDGTRLKASAMTASPAAIRSLDEQTLLASFDRKAPFEISLRSRKAAMMRKAPSKVAEESKLCTFPTKGSPKCLAILVEFQDVHFTLENPNTLFTRMLNDFIL